jgi:mRNA interferase HigB
MRVNSRKAFREFADIHQDAETPLDDWYRTAKRLRWTSLLEVRKTYPHADSVGEFTIFNIGGNKYRWATYINYKTGRVYIRHVMTHEEYSRGDWKKK